MLLTGSRHTHRWPQCETKPRRRLAAAAPSAASSRALCFVLVGVVLAGGEVGGHVGGPQAQPGGRSVRTVMDLMEAMLNRDIIDMLANGGYDFRQPARIFLPPKFYSTVPLDRGHMALEEILSSVAVPLQQPAKQQLPISAPPSSSSPLSMGGKADHQRAASGAGHKDVAFGKHGGFGGKEQVVVLDAPDGSRINLISYSDGKVTSANGGGAASAVNKGSGASEKNVPTNVKPSVVPSASGGHGRRGNEGQRPLTTSITDQTVSQNVARPVPTSGRFAGNDSRSPAPSHGGSSSSNTTDRLRAALPGEPDVDYPILGIVPATTFSCDKRHHGYYADVEARCQVFRVCANTDSTGRGFAFLCPNGTLFNQRHLVCDWYMNVRCADSENYYHLNEEIGRMMASGGGGSMVSDNRREMMAVVMSMVTYPMRSLMELMSGVGVLEERGAGLEQKEERGTEPTREGQLVGSAPYLTPVRTELEPPFAGVRSYPPDRAVPQPGAGVNGYAPVVSPSVRPQPDPSSPRPYTPTSVDDVYVSSLGTLSNDPDSGFDPVRSTLLTGNGASLGTSQQQSFPAPGYVGLQQSNRVSGVTLLSKAGPSDFQLVKADLVKSWDGRAGTPAHQPSPLRLTPVPQSYNQAAFSRTAPASPFAERFPQRTPATPPPPIPRLEQGLLPPTGVLPPTSFTRTVSIGQKQTGKLPAARVDHSEHRFAPLRKVLSVQKVTVEPEYSHQTAGKTFAVHAASGPAARAGYVQQQRHGNHAPTSLVATGGAEQRPFAQQQPVQVRQQDFYRASNPTPTGAVQGMYVHEPSYVPPTNVYIGGAVPSVTLQNVQSHPRCPFTPATRFGQPQLQRRNGGPIDVTAGGGGSSRRKSTVLVQVVPSLSYYLNNEQEKRAYDEAVRRGLLGERRRSPFTSYDVAQGSVGQLSL